MNFNPGLHLLLMWRKFMSDGFIRNSRIWYWIVQQRTTETSFQNFRSNVSLSIQNLGNMLCWIFDLYESQMTRIMLLLQLHHQSEFSWKSNSADLGNSCLDGDGRMSRRVLQRCCYDSQGSFFCLKYLLLSFQMNSILFLQPLLMFLYNDIRFNVFHLPFFICPCGRWKCLFFEGRRAVHEGLHRSARGATWGAVPKVWKP